MTKDFDAELESIFSERETRNAKARQQLAQQNAATAAFATAWDQLRTSVVVPAFNEAVGALARKGVTTDVGKLDHGVCLYFHVNAAHSARGRGREGQPYLAVLADANTQRVHFEHNSSGVGRGEGIGDMPIDEVGTDTVKSKLLTLIRYLFSER